jgi:hypothetical protein
VDWSTLEYTGLSADEMAADYAHVADTVRTSSTKPATAPDGTIWLGATTQAPERSPWARTLGRLTFLKDGKVSVALIAAVALLALTFGFRSPRRKPPTDPTT